MAAEQFARSVAIALQVMLALTSYAARRLRLGWVSAERLDQLRGEVAAELLQRLGATFIKFGQILSTRPDVVPPGWVRALAPLQDAVAPAPFPEVLRVLEEELGARRDEIVHLDVEPVAAASVAQVHRARLVSGDVVAIKVQRLEARGQIERDLAILIAGAEIVNWLPTVQMLSLPGAAREFAASLRGQLDFASEAEHNRRFARNFETVPDIAVPRLFEHLCTRRVLTMEFVEGVRATEPERVGGDRKKLARVGAECILKMVFTDGFVHADLHPGNILLTADDRVVLIDLGMVTEIPADLLRPWVETFVALSQQDGAAAARLFYVHAPTVGDVDYPEYEREVMERLQPLYGRKLAEVEVSEAVGGMMNVLRRHRVQIDPSFTVVNIAMLVAEGLGKQLDPEIDLLPLAGPYLAGAMLTAPPGREPRRAVPGVAA